MCAKKSAACGAEIRKIAMISGTLGQPIYLRLFHVIMLLSENAMSAVTMIIISVITQTVPTYLSCNTITETANKRFITNAQWFLAITRQME